jgi:predicted DNA-binding transcriptional regulator AlpA
MTASPQTSNLPVTAPTHPATGLTPLAIDAKQLGAALGLSTRKIRQLDSSGHLPRPIRIGARSVRWISSEIEAWLRAGAPDRCTWEVLRRNGKPER